ncbi:AI-2E family transporter [Algihabitans albus]|uniref:AI-2E family transporter n=1 Tax=Algihabitans albus TaxID=2164067 RepID=UPI000E5CD2E2|nr:AI-2E family transporter [Algihabitans albus]
MSPERQFRFWTVGLVVFIALLWLLSEILLPFVAGMAIAYFFDPVCDRLERLGLSRVMATVGVTGLFVVVLLLVLGLLIPAAISQAVDVSRAVPAVIDLLRERLADLLTTVQAEQPEVLDRVREFVSSRLGDAVTWLTTLAGNLLTGGLAVLSLLSLLFITPVVTFFLLRDWDTMIAKIDGWLPRQHAPTIRRLARETDDILAGYVRGMATVCLVLGTFYAIGLSLIGLNGGLFVGLLAGALSFIPYLGAMGGLLLSVGLAFAQFDNYWLVAGTAAIFMVGQAVEGNFLTPKLVGEKVGLHPVIVIFALLAGGALFGFTGVLIALPVAAVAGVLVRFVLEQYLHSPLYGRVQPAEDDVEDRQA